MRLRAIPSNPHAIPVSKSKPMNIHTLNRRGRSDNGIKSWVVCTMPMHSTSVNATYQRMANRQANEGEFKPGMVHSIKVEIATPMMNPNDALAPQSMGSRTTKPTAIKPMRARANSDFANNPQKPLSALAMALPDELVTNPVRAVKVKAPAQALTSTMGECDGRMAA